MDNLSAEFFPLFIQRYGMASLSCGESRLHTAGASADHNHFLRCGCRETIFVFQFIADYRIERAAVIPVGEVIEETGCSSGSTG